MNIEFIEGNLGGFKVRNFSCLCPACKTKMILNNKAFAVASYILIGELQCPKCKFWGALEIEMEV